MKLIDGTKSVWKKVNQLNSHLSNERSKVKSFCCPAGGIIISGEVCYKVYCTSLFLTCGKHALHIHWMVSTWYGRLVQRILEQTIIHTSFTGSSNSGWGVGIVRLHLTEALKDQTADASNCSLSLFKLIYISVKDLRMLVQIHVIL